MICNIYMTNSFLIALIVLLYLFLLFERERNEVVSFMKGVLGRTILKNAPKEEPKPVSHGHGYAAH